MARSDDLYGLYLELSDQVYKVYQAQFLVELSSFLMIESPFRDKRFGTPVQQSNYLLLIYQDAMESCFEEIEYLLEQLKQCSRSDEDAAEGTCSEQSEVEQSPLDLAGEANP